MATSPDAPPWYMSPTRSQIACPSPGVGARQSNDNSATGLNFDGGSMGDSDDEARPEAPKKKKKYRGKGGSGRAGAKEMSHKKRDMAAHSS